MYHYKDCGFPNIFIINGYDEYECSEWGLGVAIYDVYGLQNLIDTAIKRDDAEKKENHYFLFVDSQWVEMKKKEKKDVTKMVK